MKFVTKKKIDYKSEQALYISLKSKQKDQRSNDTCMQVTLLLKCFSIEVVYQFGHRILPHIFCNPVCLCCIPWRSLFPKPTLASRQLIYNYKAIKQATCRNFKDLK